MCKNTLKKLKVFFCRKKPKRLTTLTLIELLVAVTIFVLAAVLIMGQVNNAQANARDARRISDFQTFAQAMEMYLNDYGFYPIKETTICTDDPGDPLAELRGIYVSDVPKDPMANTQCYIYKTDEDGRNFKIQTKLEKNLDLMRNDGGTDPNYYEVFSLNDGQQIAIASFVAAAMFKNRTEYGDSSILGDWSMNDPDLLNPNPQTIIDSSGYQNTGQLGSTDGPDPDDPIWQSGNDCIDDNCLDYGGDDFVETPDNGTTNTACQFTLEAWVKYKNLQGMPRVLEKFTTYWLYFNSSPEVNRIMAGFKDRDNVAHEFTYSVIPQVNTWYHLAWTYDCQKIRLYINGKFDQEFTTDINGITISGKRFYSSGQNIYFAQKSDNSGFLNGLLDEIRIYNRTLSDKEICGRCRTFKDATFCNNCNQ